MIISATIELTGQGALSLRLATATVNVDRFIEASGQLSRADGGTVPTVAVVLRTHNEEEAELLRAENLGEVFLGEHELARNMASHVVEKLHSP